jgi:hypothetical protein
MVLRRSKKVEPTAPAASTPQETNIPMRRLKPPRIQVGFRDKSWKPGDGEEGVSS